MQTLRALVPRLTEAAVRFALSGDAALRSWVHAAPARPGVDVVVDRRDRHVLALLRAAGHPLANHPPELVICRLGASDPNESLRLHVPSRPPLADALAGAIVVDGLPVVDLVTLTLANLLSQRTGAEAAAAAGVRGGVDLVSLSARLDALDGHHEPKSPFIRRTFDRALARRRLADLAAATGAA